MDDQVETFSDWAGDEKSRALTVGKPLGYKVSVGRLSRTALRWRNMYSIKQNPPSGGRGLLRAECEEKEAMT
jgi:hypothetical protein